MLPEKWIIKEVINIRQREALFILMEFAGIEVGSQTRNHDGWEHKWRHIGVSLYGSMITSYQDFTPYEANCHILVKYSQVVEEIQKLIKQQIKDGY